MRGEQVRGKRRVRARRRLGRLAAPWLAARAGLAVAVVACLTLVRDVGRSTSRSSLESEAEIVGELLDGREFLVRQVPGEGLCVSIEGQDQGCRSWTQEDPSFPPL